MTKDRLREYKDLIAERDQLQALLRELDASKDAPARARMDGTPSGSRRRRGAMERGYESREQVRAALEAKKAELCEELLAIERALGSLPSRERRVLRCYYVQGLTWEQVCVETNYSWRQIHRIHSRALQLLQADSPPA